MKDLRKCPEYFENYRWEKKHKIFGYPADMYPDFDWILSLEKRFAWLKYNCVSEKTASIYLIQEMIQWGGSQNGVLQKFNDKIGEFHLSSCIADIISEIKNPPGAIKLALNIPGMGLTYASKMLRFFDPELYGALDSRITRAINERVSNVSLNISHNNVNSMTKGYVIYLNYINCLKKELEGEEIKRPKCSLECGKNTSTDWRAADIEMALFCWADSKDS